MRNEKVIFYRFRVEQEETEVVVEDDEDIFQLARVVTMENGMDKMDTRVYVRKGFKWNFTNPFQHTQFSDQGLINSSS